MQRVVDTLAQMALGVEQAVEMGGDVGAAAGRLAMADLRGGLVAQARIEQVAIARAVANADQPREDAQRPLGSAGGKLKLGRRNPSPAARRCRGLHPPRREAGEHRGPLGL